MKSKDDGLYWIPLWVDKWIFGSTRIELKPDERGVWIDICCLAAKDSGWVRANKSTAYPPEQLAGLLCISTELLDRSIKRFEETGKIKKSEDSAGFYLSNWTEYNLTGDYRTRIEKKGYGYWKKGKGNSIPEKDGMNSEEPGMGSEYSVTIEENRREEKSKEKNKPSIVKSDETKPPKKPPKQETYLEISPEEFCEMWNDTCPNLPRVTSAHKARQEKIKTRLTEQPDISWWDKCFKIANMVVIPGRAGQRDWRPTFDWMIENSTNAVKVYEGNYSTTSGPQPGLQEWARELDEEDDDGRQGSQEVSASHGNARHELQRGGHKGKSQALL